MKVELHLHTKRYSPCAVNTPEEMLLGLIARGYEAVFFTEHDALWSSRDIARLQERFPQIRIFPGLEKTLHHPSDESFQHLLILGTTSSDYLFMDDAEAIIDRAAEENLPTILAHPFRWAGSSDMLDEGLYPDAIECRTCNHSIGQAEYSRKAAAKMGMQLVNGGDAHGLRMLGRYWIETQRPFNRAQHLRDILLAGEYDLCEANQSAPTPAPKPDLVEE
jgi:hypothetical protein